jgi:cyclic pyranopterin phosphate synthase
MPLEGVTLSPQGQLMTTEERKRAISLFTQLGVTKIRFTGGEPTINRDLPELVSFAASCGIKSIGMTTNGLLLSSQLDKLCQAGLTHVNISLDTLVPSKFETISRRDKNILPRVLSAIYGSVGKGLSVKINCVLMRGVNDDEMANFIDLCREIPVDIRFIELMPFDDNNWTADKLIPYYEAIDILAKQVCCILL